MIKKSSYVCVLIVLCFTQIVAQKHAGMLIFLDDYEFMHPKSVRATYTDFVSALSQKVGPIIVSANILAIVASRYLANHTSTKNIDWQDKHVRTMIYGRPENYDSHDLLLEASQFDASEWIIKKISNCLYMLMPLSYVAASLFSLDDFNKIEHSSNATALELATGLKINHMTPVTLLASITPCAINKNYFSQALYDESNKKSSIFCLTSEYATQKMYENPVWAISIVGHGILEELVVNLSIAAFKQFLNFLAQKITTSLLAYTSCYAAGLTTEKIYSDVEVPIQTTYPYAIITKALTEAPTNVSKSVRTRAATTDFIDGKVVFKHPYTHYIDFLSAVNHDPANYKKIALSLFQDLSPSGRLANTPQIKLPGVGWFSVLADNKDVFSIGANLSKTRTKPLSITKFTKAEPKVILLNSAYIPFELILDSTKLEAIISMIPGNALHYIEKIRSTQNLMDILNVFTTLTLLGVTKQFIIHEIESLDPYNPSPIVAKNVVIYNDVNSNIAQTPEWKTVLFLGSNVYSYQKNSSDNYSIAPRNELAMQGKILREGRLLKNQFTPSTIQSFDFKDAYRKKREQTISLMNKFFNFENELRILATIDAERES